MELQVGIPKFSTLQKEAQLNADAELYGLQIFDDSETQHRYDLVFAKHQRIGIKLTAETRTVSLLLLTARTIVQRQRRDVIARAEIPLSALIVGETYAVPLYDVSLKLSQGLIRRGSMLVQLAKTSTSMVANAMTDNDEYQRDMKLLAELQRRYAQSSARLSTVGPSIQRFRRMLVPAFAIAAAEVLPASTFLWLGQTGFRPDDGSELNFYARQLNTALRFARLDAQTFQATVDRTLTGDWSSSHMPAMWHSLTLTFTMFVNAMTYTGDRTILKMPSERFKTMRNNQWCGDCEDSGMETTWEFTRFQRLNSNLFDDNALLRSLHQLSQLFVPSPFTGAVTSAQAGVEETEDDLGNHIYGALFPRAYLLEILAVDADDKRTLSSEFYRKLQPVAGERENVRVLLLEGTNFSDNQPEDPCAYVQSSKDRKAIAQRVKQRLAAVSYLETKYANLRAHYSPEIKQDKSGFGAARNLSLAEISDFYRYPIEAWFDFRHIPGLSRQFSVARWVTSDNTYGIDIRDFLDRSTDISLEPTFYYADDNDVEQINRILLRQERPLPLVIEKPVAAASSATTHEEKEMATHLLVEHILSQGRSTITSAAYRETLRAFAQKIKAVENQTATIKPGQKGVLVQWLSRAAEPAFDASKLKADPNVLAVERWSQNFAADTYDRVDLTVLEISVDTTKLAFK